MKEMEGRNLWKGEIADVKEIAGGKGADKKGRDRLVLKKRKKIKGMVQNGEFLSLRVAG